jgi:hypothetical protein
MAGDVFCLLRPTCRWQRQIAFQNDEKKQCEFVDICVLTQ